MPLPSPEFMATPLFEYRTTIECGSEGTLWIDGSMSGRVEGRVAYVGLHPWAWTEQGVGANETLVVQANLGPVAWSADGVAWYAIDVAGRRGPPLSEPLEGACPAFVQRLDEAMHLRRDFEPPGRSFGGPSLLADENGRIDRSAIRLAARIDRDCPLVQQAKPFRVPTDAEDPCVRALLSDAGFQGWMLDIDQPCCWSGRSEYDFGAPVPLPERWTREPYTVPPEFGDLGPLTCNLDASDGSRNVPGRSGTSSSSRRSPRRTAPARR